MFFDNTSEAAKVIDEEKKSAGKIDESRALFSFSRKKEGNLNIRASTSQIFSPISAVHRDNEGDIKEDSSANCQINIMP